MQNNPKLINEQQRLKMCSGSEPRSKMDGNKIKQNILNKESSGGYHTWTRTWSFWSALRTHCHATLNSFLRYETIKKKEESALLFTRWLSENRLCEREWLKMSNFQHRQREPENRFGHCGFLVQFHCCGTKKHSKNSWKFSSFSTIAAEERCIIMRLNSFRV